MGQKSDPLWLEYGVLDMMSNKWSSSEEDEDDEEDDDEMRGGGGELGWSDIEREREQNSRTERLLQTAQERQYDYGPNEITSFSRSGRARKKNKWLHDDCYEVYVNTGVPRNKGSYEVPSHLPQPTLNIVVETPDSPPSPSPPPQHFTNKKGHKKTTSTRDYALPPRHHQTDSRNVFSAFSFDDEDHVTTPSHKKRNPPSTIVSIIPETSSSRFQPKTSNTAVRTVKKSAPVPVSKPFNIVKVKSLPTPAKIKPQPQVVIKRAVNLSIPPIRIISTNGQSPRTLPNIVAFTTSHQTVPVQPQIVTTSTSTQSRAVTSKPKVCNRVNSIDEKPSFFESLDEMVRSSGATDAVDDDDIITLNLEPVNFGANGPAVTNSPPEDDFAPENEDERNFFQSFESLLQS